MEDYKEMSYFDVKKECKKLNIDSKGTKIELLERLGADSGSLEKAEKESINETKAEEQKLSPEEKTIIYTATQEELNKYSPEATFGPSSKGLQTKYDEWINVDRIKKLEEKLAPVFAGRGTFEIQLDHQGGSYGVEFNGGASGKEYTTIIDTDQQILTKAGQYITRRLARGSNGQQSRM